MMTEKETIEKILRRRAIILKDGSIDEARFRKFVTETWLYSKAVKYGFCPADKKLVQDNEIKNETPVEENVIRETDANFESPLVGGGKEELEESEVQDPIPAVEEPVADEATEPEPEATEPEPEATVEPEAVDNEPVAEVETVSEPEPEVQDPIPVVEEPVAEEKASPKKKSTKKK